MSGVNSVTAGTLPSSQKYERLECARYPARCSGPCRFPQAPAGAGRSSLPSSSAPTRRRSPYSSGQSSGAATVVSLEPGRLSGVFMGMLSSLVCEKQPAHDRTVVDKGLAAGMLVAEAVGVEEVLRAHVKDQQPVYLSVREPLRGIDGVQFVVCVPSAAWAPY